MRRLLGTVVGYPLMYVMISDWQKNWRWPWTIDLKKT